MSHALGLAHLGFVILALSSKTPLRPTQMLPPFWRLGQFGFPSHIGTVGFEPTTSCFRRRREQPDFPTSRKVAAAGFEPAPARSQAEWEKPDFPTLL